MDLELHTTETVIPSRTRYQLRQFVIGQHDTAPMRWRQVLLEAQDLSYKIRMAELSVEKAYIEIDRLLSSGDPIKAIEAEEKRVEIALTERTLAAARMELQWLQEIAEEVGVHSIEDIELDQPNYWNKRLQRQADTDVLAAQRGISSGNITSMINAGILQYKEETGQCAISPGD